MLTIRPRPARRSGRNACVTATCPITLTSNSGFLARRRQVLHDVLGRARARGEIADATDVDFLVELVFGALWYRILGRHAPLNRRFDDRLAATVLDLAR